MWIDKREKRIFTQSILYMHFNSNIIVFLIVFAYIEHAAKVQEMHTCGHSIYKIIGRASKDDHISNAGDLSFASFNDMFFVNLDGYVDYGIRFR